MRAIFKASISFGLVNVPVKLYSAIEEHDIKAHQVHAHDGGQIGYQRVCKTCQKAVESRDIVKQYQTDEGGTVTLSEDDLAGIGEANNREISVLEFVPASELDPLMFDKAYYLEPDGAGKAYALLTQALGQTDRVAIVRFTMRSKTHLAALRVVGKGDVLAVQTLHWSDEIREPDFPSIKPVEVSDAEMKVAGQLIESMAGERFVADKYRDTYQEELRELIADKAVETSEDGAEEVSDLLAKLTESAAALQPKPKRRGRKPKVLAGVA